MAKKTPAKKLKRNPTDATLRNVRAANKRADDLEIRVTNVALALGALQARVEAIERKETPQP